jgi:hypothetical protein
MIGLSIRERANIRARKERSAILALARLQVIGEMWPSMDATIWQQYSLQLFKTRRETEERRVTGIIETKTEMLQALPKLSAQWWLQADEEILAPAEEPERTTDADVEISPYATRKLSTTPFIETEKRAAVKQS